jgi:hypothetical protein
MLHLDEALVNSSDGGTPQDAADEMHDIDIVLTAPNLCSPRRGAPLKSPARTEVRWPLTTTAGCEL